MKNKNETGYSCEVPGTYRCADCTVAERKIACGKTLPVCPFCHTAVTWTLVSEEPAMAH